MEQQRPRTASGMPSCPARRRWFQSCSVSPTTVCPCARSMAATAEESTPPDMATAMVSTDEGTIFPLSQVGLRVSEFGLADACFAASLLPVCLEGVADLHVALLHARGEPVGALGGAAMRK